MAPTTEGEWLSGVHIWASLIVRWVLTLSPTRFRFARSRWSCEAAAVVLRDDYRVRVGRETVRRWLRAAGLVRRPRPVIRLKDPDRKKKLAALRALLRGLPADETAEANETRYLAGSIHWRTRRVILTEGRAEEGRSAALSCPGTPRTRTRSSGCGGGPTRP